MRLLILAAVLMTSPAMADEWSDGWCAGYEQAQKSLMQNRDHWRSLLREPNETHEQTLNRIYSQPWIGPLAPRTLDRPAGEPKIGPSIADSADLYLVLPPLPPGTKIMLEDRVITCPQHTS